MQHGRHTILQGNVLKRLKDVEVGTCQQCITSPPYWGLRDYQTGRWEGGSDECDHKMPPGGGTRSSGLLGDNSQDNIDRKVESRRLCYRDVCRKCGAVRIDDQIGNEPTPELYVEKLVQVFRGVREALTETGTLWLNIGDTMANDSKWGGTTGGKHVAGLHGEPVGREKRATNLKAGDQCLIPHRVAMALQADGWFLRSTIIWHKKNAMPESVSGFRWVKCRVKVAKGLQSAEPSKVQTKGKPHSQRSEDGKEFDRKVKWRLCPGCDKCRPNNGLILRRSRWRPSNSFEYIFLFSKSERYFCDGDAVQEIAVGRAPGNKKSHKGRDAALNGDVTQRTKLGLADTGARETRNQRNVWTLSSENYRGAHFAVFPSELVRRCLLAGTSAAGCCPKCLVPYAPIVETDRKATRPGNDSKVGRVSDKASSPYHEHNGDVVGNRDPQRHTTTVNIIGYKASCSCSAGPAIPCKVLDCFAGSCTTLQVATWYGRDAIGIELNEKYIALGEERIATPPRCLQRERKEKRKPPVVAKIGTLFDALEES